MTREDTAVEILRAIVASPYGCAFCDSGKLRTEGNPAKDHDEDCGFARAVAFLAGGAAGPQAQPVFTVEVDDDGCSKCSHGKTWGVLGPDDVASSQSWADEEDAQHFADEMNRAYELGQKLARGDAARVPPAQEPSRCSNCGAPAADHPNSGYVASKDGGLTCSTFRSEKDVVDRVPLEVWNDFEMAMFGKIGNTFEVGHAARIEAFLLGMLRATRVPPAQFDHTQCHDLVCNTDRAKYPRGAKGVGCSCVSRAEREAVEFPPSRDQLTIEALQAASVLPATPQGWQPIETAPKDGSAVLGFGLHSGSPPDAQRGVKAGDHWWTIMLWDCWRHPDPAGWGEQSLWVFAKDGKPTWSYPTHWMPLPAAPRHAAGEVSRYE